jgi:hypothetical protein
MKTNMHSTGADALGGGDMIRLHLLTPNETQILDLPAFTFPAGFTLRAAMATLAILDVGDPFFAVFRDDVGLLQHGSQQGAAKPQPECQDHHEMANFLLETENLMA